MPGTSARALAARVADRPGQRAATVKPGRATTVATATRVTRSHLLLLSQLAGLLAGSLAGQGWPYSPRLDRACPLVLAWT